MKSSELKGYIKELIVSELSEITTMVGPKTNPADASKIAQSGQTDQNTVRTAIDRARRTNSTIAVAEEETNEVRVKQPISSRNPYGKMYLDKLIKILNNFDVYLGTEKPGVNISTDRLNWTFNVNSLYSKNLLIQIINTLNGYNFPYHFRGKYPDGSIYNSDDYELTSIYDLPDDIIQNLKLYVGDGNSPFKGRYLDPIKPEDERRFKKSEPVDKIMIDFIKNNIPINPDESTTFHFPLNKINPRILQYLNKNGRLDIDMADSNYGYAVIYKGNGEVIIEFNSEYKPDTLKSREDLLKTIRSRPRPDDEVYPEKYMFKNAPGVASESINEEIKTIEGRISKLNKITEHRKNLEENMKTLVGKWKLAEGEEKNKILISLKEKTKTLKTLKKLQNKYIDNIV